jgi:hypothetical protein
VQLPPNFQELSRIIYHNFSRCAKVFAHFFAP